MKAIRYSVPLALLGMAMYTAGCAPSKVDRESAPAIRLSLNWFPDSQHAGFYAAEAFGLFQQQQLPVRIIPGGPATPVVQYVAQRQTDFAVANADQILMARAAGAPVVAVLASMQDSPRCIMVHQEAGIQSLRNLRDVTLAVGAGQAFAMFLQQQVPLENVKTVPYTGSVALFLQDHRFAQQAYVFSEPYVAQQKGAHPLTLMVSELGFNPYSSCLIAHEELIRSEPDKVGKVVSCVRQGWLDYFRNPQPVHKQILAVNSQMDAASLDYGMQALRALCLPPGQPDSVIGSMEPQRWQTMCDQLIQLGLLPEGTDPTGAYTNQFIVPLTSQPAADERPVGT
jgi:NitT/TauT family transport system substrate-binding protein